MRRSLGFEQAATGPRWRVPAAWPMAAVALCLLVAAEVGLGFAVNDAKVLLLYLAGLGGVCLVVATLLRPPTSVVVLLFVLFTRLSDVYGPSDGLLSVNQMLMALFLFSTLAYRLVGRGEAPVTDRTLGWMLAFGLAMALSSLGAQDVAATMSGLMEYVREAIIVFVLLNLITTLGALRAATWTLVMAGAFLAAAATLYVGLGYDFGGLASAEISQIAGSEQGSRLTGVTQDSNIFAQMLVPVVPLALYRAWDERNVGLRALAMALVALVSLVVVLTFSRGAIVALVIVAGVGMTMQRARPWRIIAFGLALAAVALAAPSSYWERIDATVQYVAGTDSQLAASDGSARERSLLWRVGVQMFVEHPISGVGLGNYLQTYSRYAWQIDPTLTSKPTYAHSLPVHLAAETGLVGLTTFAGMLIAAVSGLRQAKRRCALAGRGHDAMCLEAVELAVYGYLVTSLFLSGTSRYTWLLIGLAMVGRQAALRSVPIPHLKAAVET